MDEFVQMTGNVGSEMSVIIPKRSSSKLPDLFKALEIRQEKLKVESLGLYFSDTLVRLLKSLDLLLPWKKCF